MDLHGGLVNNEADKVALDHMLWTIIQYALIESVGYTKDMLQ